MQLLFEFQDMYSQHKYDFFVVAIPIRITLKQDAALKKQRITKIPIHCREKIQAILDELETNGLIEPVGLDAAQNHEISSEFISPFKIFAKGDTYNYVFDATLLNAETDFSKYPFPSLPVQVLMTKFIGSLFSTIDLSSAFHQVALTPETQKIVRFLVGIEQYKDKRGFN